MNRQLLCLVFSLLTLCGNQLRANLNMRGRIDSLKVEMRKQKSDTGKLTLLCDISYQYGTVNPDSGMILGKQALALATKMAWKKGMAKANQSLGNNARFLSDLPAALAYFEAALAISQSLGDQTNTGATLSDIGNIYGAQGNFTKALDYFQKALKIEKSLGDKYHCAKITGNIGIVFSIQGENARAMKYLVNARETYIELGDESGITGVDINIGNLYMNWGEYSKALEYYFKALRRAEKNDDKSSIEGAFGNIGIVFKEQHEYSKALEYFLKALKINEETGYKDGVCRLYCDIGVIYNAQGNNTLALKYFSDALKIGEEIGDAQILSIISGNIGGVYADNKDYTQAIAWHLKSLNTARDIGDKVAEVNALYYLGGDYYSIVADPPVSGVVNSPNSVSELAFQPDAHIPKDRKTLLNKARAYINQSIEIGKAMSSLDHLQRAYRDLSSIDSMLGDYKGALDAYMLHAMYHDSVFSQDNDKKIMQQQMTYQFGKKEDSLKLINAGKEQKAALKFQKQRSYTYLGVAGVLALGVFSLFIFRNNKLLGKEKKRSDDLLLNILPEEVAEELKTTGATTAKHYNNVTVLFTDFVNFTQAGEQMSPQALIDELHACFKTFDEIAEKYNIEKIKTIGDAYLAVGGLPTADAKHAENVVRAAIEINAFMSDRLAKMGSDRTFAIRIGIHSGSVVAGIVGVKKFAYDIWGDTVNTAARMEQNSEAGKINISQTTYDLVKDKFACEYRGEVEAKGKGVMKMYFVSAVATA